ncbi:MAG: NRAMP family divalent metal transporter [Peptoniphilus harei]|nr:divalent metal cation transporter [Peptoniphilus harei]MDU5466609.1 NRAMP family divalent metal transporter [Peptoniphilus harei]
MKNKKSDLSVLIGAAFLMAASSAGPGFIAQTGTYTYEFGLSFAFVIISSVIISYIAQLNVWRVIAVSKMRGQDIANKVLPGLGYFIAILVALGGLAFNIGNVGGAGLGLNVIFGIDARIGAAIGGIIGIIIFASPSAKSLLDQVTKYFGIGMIILITYVAVKTNPPIAEAAKSAFLPGESITNLFPPIITLIGGTVGGYIIFSGGHRLIDAGITGEENLGEVNKSASLGIVVALILRIVLFLAILGAMNLSMSSIDPDNIPASAFKIAAGNLGYKIFGIVFFISALTPIVGAAYTSVSFLKTLFKTVEDHESIVTIIFIVISTIAFILIGKPQKLLVVVGTLNGFILPITLAVILLASKNKKIVGNYRHSNLLYVLGWLVVIFTAYMSLQTVINSFGNLMG